MTTSEKIQPMLNKRAAHAAAALDGRIYVCGGYDGHGVHDSAECYDSVSKEWKMIAPMKYPRLNFLLIEFDYRLYAIGGNDGKKCHSDVQIYDPATRLWTYGCYRDLCPRCAPFFQ